MAVCVVCGGEASRLYVCCECGRLVCDLCYVEAVDMCTGCEETWETEETLTSRVCVFVFCGDCVKLFCSLFLFGVLV
jgi:hypothetical protein